MSDRGYRGVKGILPLTVFLAVAIAFGVYWRRSVNREAQRRSDHSPEFSARAKASSPSETQARPPFSVDNFVPVGPTMRAEKISRAEVLVKQIQTILGSDDLKELEKVFTSVLPELVQMNAAAAARLAESISEGVLRDEIMRRVAQLWAEKDSQGAFAWAEKLSNQAEREAALEEVGTQIAKTDPARAVAMNAETLPPNQGNSALENLAQHWAETDFHAALDWTLTRAQGNQRDGVLARLAFIRARTAPAEAATLVVANMSPGFAQNEAVLSVLHEWAQNDLNGAAAWLGQFPDDGFRERCLRELTHVAQYQESKIAP